ncbi:MAG: PrsW family glutamic-type intramembrane protease [Ktedonobacteraceae bacterium]
MHVPNFEPPGSSSPGPQQNVQVSQTAQDVAHKSQGDAYVPVWTGAYPPVDPQQPLREYVSPRAWTPPSYPAAGAYPPAQPVYPGQPNTPLPSYPNYGAPTYPYLGYNAPTYAYPSYGTPTYAYPGYGVLPTPTYAYPGYGMPPTPTYAYPGYGAYPWPPMAAQPKRDTYLFVVAIIAFVGSCLAILGGLASLGILLLTSVLPHQSIAPDQLFASITLFLALTLAGLVGGGFCAYHSIRALFLKKISKSIWLPGFWIFLLGYLAILVLCYCLSTRGQSTASPLLTGLLIYLSAILPALTILALGIRRLRFSFVEQWVAFGRSVFRQPLRLATVPARDGQWPTSWRRLAFALVSGATLSVFLAALLEYLIQSLLLGSQGNAVVQSLSDPNANLNPSQYGALLILLALVAPIVEELVKPLAVVLLIGRVKSKAEAFALGLACGIGFNLVETTGYISSGYNDWLQVALVRSGAGLLHGFGAAMVALGWYILTHKEEGRRLRRLLLGFGCGLYAIAQHALWNGSWGFALLPGPIGNFFQNWSWTIGTFTLDASELINIVEMLGILIFFIYMAGRLRIRTKGDSDALENKEQPLGGSYSASV